MKPAVAAALVDAEFSDAHGGLQRAGETWTPLHPNFRSRPLHAHRSVEALALQGFVRLHAGDTTARITEAGRAVVRARVAAFQEEVRRIMREMSRPPEDRR